MGYTPVAVQVTQKIDGLDYNDFNTNEKVILLTISIRSSLIQYYHIDYNKR